jgi:hypothetical protein
VSRLIQSSVVCGVRFWHSIAMTRFLRISLCDSQWIVSYDLSDHASAAQRARGSGSWLKRAIQAARK